MPHGKISLGAGERFEQHASACLQVGGQFVPRRKIADERAAELALFQQGGDVLFELPLRGAQSLAHTGRLGEQDKRVRRVVEQGA